MAFSLSSHISLPPSFSTKPNYPNISSTIKPRPIFTLTPITKPINRNPQFTVFTAIEDSKSSVSEESTAGTPPVQQEKESSSDELSELGAEIKKAMKEREESKGSGDFWSGVSEEIGEIEWPAFNKVLSTTGVVLGVIAGSSVVLLTVNAVLAELSDQVFNGKGFQDFFG